MHLCSPTVGLNAAFEAFILRHRYIDRRTTEKQRDDSGTQILFVFLFLHFYGGFISLGAHQQTRLRDELKIVYHRSMLWFSLPNFCSRFIPFVLVFFTCFSFLCAVLHLKIIFFCTFRRTKLRISRVPLSKHLLLCLRLTLI